MIHIGNECIESIDLLSVEEAEALPVWMLCCGKWWWLRSPGFNSARAAGVNFTGSVRVYGHGVSDNSDSVRPALHLSHLPELEFGETVKVFGRLAQYIGDGKILFSEPIFQARFDERLNVYRTSEVKMKLDEWLKKELEKPDKSALREA